MGRHGRRLAGLAAAGPGGGERRWTGSGLGGPVTTQPSPIDLTRAEVIAVIDL